jgi:periplasmic protein TonB
MKTIEKAENTAVQAKYLEDIIFEGRNQNYGAYHLRKTYNNHLNLSLLIVISFAAVVISLAFLHSFMTPSVIEEPIKKIVEFKPEYYPVQPELPPPPAKKVIPLLTQNVDKDAPPVIVENAAEEDQLLPEGDIIEQIGNTKVPAVIPIEPPVTNIPDDVNKTYTESQVSTQALFSGGSVENFRKWLSKNIHYPEDAISNEVNGKVILQFTIDKSGNICDIVIVRGIHPVIDQAAVRALKSSPKWTAATINGKPVKVSYYLPIAFCILK